MLPLRWHHRPQGQTLPTRPAQPRALPPWGAFRPSPAQPGPASPEKHILDSLRFPEAPAPVAPAVAAANPLSPTRPSSAHEGATPTTSEQVPGPGVQPWNYTLAAENPDSGSQWARPCAKHDAPMSPSPRGYPAKKVMRSAPLYGWGN